MDVLTGAFHIVAAVIAVGGVAKLAAPGPFAEVLRSLGVPGRRAVARGVGGGELALGAAAVAVGGTALALAVSGAYVAFAATVVLARRRGAPSCGCFGTASAPPSLVHVVVDVVAAAAALAAAWAGGPPGVVEVLGDQPLGGVPYVAALGLGTWLVVVLDTVGAQLVREIRSVAALADTFRRNAPGADATPGRAR